MTKLNVSYQGFKLGVRVADALALALDTHKEADVRTLHKLKNMAYCMETMRQFKAFSIDGQSYVRGE